MEKLSRRRRVTGGVMLAVATLFAGCTVDSYNTDTTNVQCDGTRTKTDLSDNGVAAFIVHSPDKSKEAVIKVRHNSEGVSTNVTGDVTGPPQFVKLDDYTPPVPVVTGPELVTFGAGGVWMIDVRKDTVVIQGSCAGL